MLRFIALFLAIACAGIAVAIFSTWITSPYGPAWASGSLGLLEVAFLPDAWARRHQP